MVEVKHLLTKSLPNHQIKLKKGNQEEPKPQVFQEMTSSITTIDGWEKDEDVPSNVTFYKKDGFQ